jgi:hypothetical protein
LSLCEAEQGGDNRKNRFHGAGIRVMCRFLRRI